MHRFLRHTITVCHKNKSNKAKQKCFPIVNPVAQMIYRHVFSMSTTEVANALKDEVHTQVDQRFRACINQVIDKQMRPDQFLRALMEHETWYLPVNKETDTFQNRFRDENNKLYYFYYSDLQAMITGDNYFMYKNVTEKFPEERYFLTLPGFKAFGSIDDEADIISINPHSPPFEVHYKKHQIALLKQWAQTVHIEYLIRTLDDDNLQELFKPMGTYEHFWIVLNKRPQGEDYDIVLAPDLERRYLIAIFTAEDLVDDFLTRRAQELGQKSIDNDIKYKVSGKELFPQLAAMRPEGIVFNCFREARAFNYSFIEFVISRD